jgi:hypothetical protein
VIVYPELTQPCEDLVDLVVLEELMDTATAQPCRRSDLPDREASSVGSNNRPDPFLLRVGQPYRGETQPRLELLFPSDTLV